MAKGVITDVIDIKNVTSQIDVTLKGLERIAVKIDEINAGMAKTGKGSGGKASGSYDAEKAQAMELDRTLQKLKATESELSAEIVKQKAALSEKQKQQKTENDAINSMLSLTAQIAAREKLLAQRYKETALAQGIASKAAKQALKDYTELHKKTTEIDRSMGNYRDNVGNYASALQGFGGAAGKAGDVISGVTQKLATSPWLLVASVVVSAVAGMVASLKSVDSASDSITKTWEGMKTVGTVLTDRVANLTIGLAKFVSGDFKAGVDQVKESFNGLGEAMTRAAIAGERYSVSMDVIEESNIQFMSKEAKLRNDAAKLIEVYQDVTVSPAKRKAALAQSMDYEKQIYEHKKSMAEKTYRARLQLAEGETGISTKILEWVVNNDRETVLSRAKTDTRIKKAWEKLYGKGGELAKSLQESKAAVLNADSEEFEGKKKAIAKLTGFEKEMNTTYAQANLDAKKAAFEAEKREIDSLILAYQRLARAARGGSGSLKEGPRTAQVDTGIGKPPALMSLIDNPMPGTREGSMDNSAEENRTLAQAELSADAAKWQAKFQIAQEFTQKIDALVTASFSNRFAELDKEAQKDEANKTKELERAKGNKGQIEEINKRYAAKEKERDKERRRLEVEQAKYKKASGIVGAIINTAVAVTGMLANPGGVLGIVLAALTAVTGAAEIAMIASQPIPSYAKGRKGGKAEFANVGERGVEKIITKSGAEYFTPGTSTLAYLPEGAEVVPHHKLMEQARLAAFGHSDFTGSAYDFQMVQTNTRIEETNRKLDILADVIKNKREVHMSFDKRGFATSVRNGATWEQYVNNNVRL